MTSARGVEGLHEVWLVTARRSTMRGGKGLLVVGYSSQRWHIHVSVLFHVRGWSNDVYENYVY